MVRGGRTRGSSLSAQNKLLARLRIRPFFDRMPKGEITWIGGICLATRQRVHTQFLHTMVLYGVVGARAGTYEWMASGS